MVEFSFSSAHNLQGIVSAFVIFLGKGRAWKGCMESLKSETIKFPRVCMYFQIGDSVGPFFVSVHLKVYYPLFRYGMN